MRQIVLMVILFCSIEPANAQRDTAYLYVSPTGKKSGDGSMKKPFFSPEQARNQIRNLRASKKDFIGVVYLMKGLYHRKTSLQLDQQDSATVYKNWQQDAVVFHGGKKIAPNAFEVCSDPAILRRLPSETVGKLWMADLKKEGVVDYGEMKQHGFGTPVGPASMELFVNGKAQTLGRYPNEGILPIGRIIDAGSKPRYGDFSNRGAVFGYEYDRASRWAKAKDIWLHGKFSFGYNDDHLKVKSIDTVRKNLYIDQPHLYGVWSSIYPDSSNKEFKAGQNVRGYYAYNLLEEIDQPGEWFLDRTSGKLYLYPEIDLKQAEIEISMMEAPFIELNSTSNIHISGVNFTCSRGLGVLQQSTHHVVIENCSFSNLGTIAISMGPKYTYRAPSYNADGSPNTTEAFSSDFHDNIIRRVRVNQTGTGGIVVSGGNRQTLTPANNLVEDCDFSVVDRINATYSPAVKLMGVGSKIRYCSFRDIKHTAVNFGGNNHLIEYNKFERCCVDADDMGVIYTGRNPSARGTVIQFNYFANNLPNNKQSKMCGVYIDDGSGGIVVQKNLFYKTGNPGAYSFAAVFMHGGFQNKVEQNVFMDCKAAVSHTVWDENRWKTYLQSPVIQSRLLKDVNIESDTYLQAYPELKGYFLNTLHRLNEVKNNVVIRTQLVYTGDLSVKGNLLGDGLGDTPYSIDFETIGKRISGFKPVLIEQTGVRKL